MSCTTSLRAPLRASLFRPSSGKLALGTNKNEKKISTIMICSNVTNTNTRTTTNTTTTRREQIRKSVIFVGLSAIQFSSAFFTSSINAEAKLSAFEYDEAKMVKAANGLEFVDVVVGTGAKPVKGQTIQAHYTGRLTNGRVFDSSYERGSPLKFKVGVRQVIQGWDDGILGCEGIEGMRVGGKRVLIIPSDLAYGERGAGGVIPGGATLKFDVELVALL